MSKINDIVMKHIRNYDIAKTGEWHKLEPPPPNTFDLSEIYIIGRCIVSEIEGIIVDKFMGNKESKLTDPISTECEHEWVYVCGIFKGSSSTTEMKWRCKKCLITRITYE